MRSHKILLLIFLLLSCSGSTSFAVEVEDTIMSMSKDYVFVKYNIGEHNGKITVSFSEVRKRLGLKYRDKYRKLNDVCVLFFDRGGDYKDKFKSDIGTEPLKVRSNEIRYIQSDDGYVRLDNRTDISLDLLTDQSTLSLPIYLAHYEGKQHYKVFAKCENLNIRLSKRAKKGASGNAMEVVKREIPVTEEVEVGTDITPAQEAELLIDNVRESLGQDTPSMATLESLGRKIDRLRDLEVVIPDMALKSKINNILQIYDSQKQAAKQQQDDEDKMERQMADQQENEKQAKGDLAYLTERLEHSEEWTEEDLGELKSCSNSLRRKAHSIENPELAQEMKDAADKCDEEIKKAEEAKKKRNLLMIAGGVLLCILLFVGNQLSQHIRNMRNIKSMGDTQNKIAKRAEDEALRRAQSTARSKANRVQAQVSQKSHEYIKANINSAARNIGKNTKKNVSI